MQNVVNNLVKSLKELQSPAGPITPRPGPIFPIDEAAIDNDDITPKPLLVETNNAHMTNIKM